MHACEFLAWDSEFFGVRVARVTGSWLDDGILRDVETWCRESAIDCLYFLAAERSASDDEWRRERGFIPVDERVTFERAVPDAETAPAALRLATESDVPALRRIAARSHHATRFYTDPRFRAAADRLYACWIEKSVRERGTAVFVNDGSEPEGYITCSVPEPHLGNIGLVAVDAPARGKGLGGRLVGAALGWCRARGCARVRVVTQGANTAALQLYTRGGFQPVLTEWWYHRWFTAAAAR